MERIKAYFEEAIKTDPALAEAYDESKLKDCWDYITKQAKKKAVNSCAMIEDAEVYKWARDFMYGDIEEDKKPEPKTEEKPAETELMKITEVNEVPDAEPEEEIEEQEPEKNEPAIELPSSKIVEDTFEVFDGPGTAESHFCGVCGYFNGDDKYPSGACLLKHTSVLKVQISCKEFINTPAASKIEQAKTEVKKEKKSKKKEDFYDGPSLFDDMF